jgi:phage tail sheath protein FI
MFEVLMSKIDEWKESYPAVDVEQEVRKCRQWNVDNPSRRKTARGVLKHVSAWLARCQDRGGSYGRGVDAFDGPKDVRSFSDEELERMKAQGEPGRTSFGEETVKSHGDT